MDETIGNQQVKADREIDLAYLAGALDGEGCFTIARKADKRYKQWGYSYSPMIYFTNTNADFIARISEILDAFGISGHIMTRKQPMKTGNKDYYVISIGRFSSISKLLDLILPFLVAKKGQAKLLNRFVKVRLEKNHEKYKSQNPYTDEEISLVQQIRTLNGSSKIKYPAESSEAIRQAAQ